MARTRHHGNKAKERTYGEDWKWWGWLQNYPGWWDTMFHHAPARRKERDLLKAAEKGATVTDWPDHRKPHTYYW